MDETIRAVIVSKGNKKMGDIPNISQPPGLSCAPGVLCFTDGCYALGSYNRYPNAKKAWDYNFKNAKELPEKFMEDLYLWLKAHQPQFFRFHVSGDFISQDYLNGLIQVARASHRTKFMAFTKKYNLNYLGLPGNFKVIWSMWPGIDLPPAYDGWPTAWLTCDDRRPKDKPFIHCPGYCEACTYSCWNMITPELPVFFDKHR